jgi:hypothetical protein
MSRLALSGSGGPTPEQMDQILTLAAQGHEGAIGYLQQNVGFTPEELKVAAEKALHLSAEASELLQKRLKQTQILTPSDLRTLRDHGVPLEESVLGFLAREQSIKVFQFTGSAQGGEAPSGSSSKTARTKTQNPAPGGAGGLEVARAYFAAQLAAHGIDPATVATKDIRGEGWQVIAKALETTPQALQADPTLSAILAGAAGENGILSRREAQELLSSFPLRGRGWSYLAKALDTDRAALLARIAEDPELSAAVARAGGAGGGPGHLSEKEARRLLLDPDFIARWSAGPKADPLAEVAAVEGKPSGQVSYGSMRAMFAEAAAAPPGIRGILMERADQRLADYYQGFAKAFPDPDERDPLPALKEYLLDPEMPKFDVMTIELDGKTVGGLHRDEVGVTPDLRGLLADALKRAGGAADLAQISQALEAALKAKGGKLDPDADPSVVATGMQFIWIDEDNRFAGAGKQVVRTLDQQVAAAKQWGVFAEVNDPARMTEAQRAEDSIDPRIRRAFYQDLGYRAVDARYIQLPIEEGMQPVDYLGFLVKPADPKATSIPADVYLSMVTEYFAGFPKYAADTPQQTLANIFADPQYQEIVASIGKRKSLPLLDGLSVADRLALPARPPEA